MLNSKVENLEITKPCVGKIHIVKGRILCMNQEEQFELPPNDFLQYQESDIVSIMPNGVVSILYRSQWEDLTLFITNQCNSACIMCPQVCDKSGHLLDLNLRILELIPENVKHIGITGGEPTIFPEEVIQLLRKVHQLYPDIPISFLTNGRAFKNMEFVRELKKVGHVKILFCIPLYSANYEQHDYIVGANGAFIETVTGIFNLFKLNQMIEIQTVLFAETVGLLNDLCEYIARNMPFVRHVAIMGMEYSGYAAKRYKDFWIDPYDYKDVLGKSGAMLYRKGMLVSIYNIPLCLLSENIRFLARDSISTWKKIYPVKCDACKKKELCCGVFETSVCMSKRIKAL